MTTDEKYLRYWKAMCLSAKQLNTKAPAAVLGSGFIAFASSPLGLRLIRGDLTLREENALADIHKVFGKGQNP